MAKSPIVLLNNVSAVGAGSIVDMEDKPITGLLFRIEPSADATVDGTSYNGIAAISLQYSLDSGFPEPTIPDSARTVEICQFNFDLIQPGQVSSLAPYSWPVSFVKLNAFPQQQRIVLPFIRAKLLIPLASGTVTLKFFFE